MLDFFTLIFFNVSATTQIYTLSLHDALPISGEQNGDEVCSSGCLDRCQRAVQQPFEPRNLGVRIKTLELRVVLWIDRKSTRLNSSHVSISYAVFCLKKKRCRKNDLS